MDEDFLLELHMEGIAYLNVTPLQMLTHLRDRWVPWLLLMLPPFWKTPHFIKRCLTFCVSQKDAQCFIKRGVFQKGGNIDITALLAECDTPWNALQMGS